MHRQALDIANPLACAQSLLPSLLPSQRISTAFNEYLEMVAVNEQRWVGSRWGGRGVLLLWRH